MAKPKLTVKDRGEVVYHLLATKMVEPLDDDGEGDNRREVLRKGLKKALCTSYVYYRFICEDGDTESVEVCVRHSAVRVDIGCRTFTGENAKALLKWAKGK